MSHIKADHAIFFSVACGIVLLDQATKLLVSGSIGLHGPVTLMGGILSISYIQNTGAGFGILKGFTGVLASAGVAAIGIIGYYYQRILELGRGMILATGILLGGIIGNLIDRIAHGFVIDFIDFGFWPAFNVADSAVTVAGAFLILYLWGK